MVSQRIRWPTRDLADTAWFTGAAYMRSLLNWLPRRAAIVVTSGFEDSATV